MPSKAEEQDAGETGEEEGQEYEQGGTTINITDEMISVEVARDGNEGETLSRLAQLVDGLGS
ncbi:MAG: hypothetical protein JWO14_2272 [Solirubrobacterales bacterium]|jgi:hypothetical protein|nr:hypothetical protein [Solirubrobacterales bacterium]